MNGQEMVNDVVAKLGKEDGVGSNDTFALQFLNVAQDIVTRKHNFRSLESQDDTTIERTSVAGATISDNGSGYIRLTSAGNFTVSKVLKVGASVNCDFSATYTDGDYAITAVDTSSGNYIDIDLAWSTNVPTATVLLPLEFWFDQPSDYKQLISARFTIDGGNNYGELIILSSGQMEQMIHDQSNRRVGTPRYIATYGKDASVGMEFRLYPTPNQAGEVAVRYYKEPTDLVDDTSTPDLEAISDVLVAGAVWRGFIQERAWESANRWEGIFRRMLSEAMADDMDDQGWTPIMQPHKMHTINRETIFETDYEIDAPASDYWS